MIMLIRAPIPITVIAIRTKADGMASPSRTYVLVHGAWHGGWVWKDVAPALRAMGHSVTTPTMTGLGERKHLASFPYDLETHITDIVEHIDMERLTDIDLVGWSYGGMVTTGVLARMRKRVRSMIYLDAFLPDNGKALADYAEGPARAAMDAAKQADKPMPPIPMKVFGVTDPVVIAFAQPRLVDQSWRCFFQPVKALAERPRDIPHTYVRCSGFDPSPFSYFLEQAGKDANFRTHVMPTSHHCMLTDPTGTIEILGNAD